MDNIFTIANPEQQLGKRQGTSRVYSVRIAESDAQRLDELARRAEDAGIRLIPSRLIRRALCSQIDDAERELAWLAEQIDRAPACAGDLVRAAVIDALQKAPGCK